MADTTPPTAEVLAMLEAQRVRLATGERSLSRSRPWSEAEVDRARSAVYWLEKYVLPLAKERDRLASEDAQLRLRAERADSLAADVTRAYAARDRLRAAATDYATLAGPICVTHDSDGDPDCTDCVITQRFEAALRGDT